jgi:ATP-dependent Lon protease
MIWDSQVIKESGEIALTWVKTHAYDLCITNLRSEDALKIPDPIDIHLHLPAGAQKKDGPSAGIAMICAFVSLLTGSCVPKDIAMTGEVRPEVRSLRFDLRLIHVLDHSSGTCHPSGWD